MTRPDTAQIRVTINGWRIDVDEGTTVVTALVLARVLGTRVSVRDEPCSALCGYTDSAFTRQRQFTVTVDVTSTEYAMSLRGASRS
jgi:hypothetical protein